MNLIVNLRLYRIINTMRRKLILLSLLILAIYKTVGQDLDSLELLLKGGGLELKVEDRLRLFDDLSWGYLNSDFEKAMLYGEKGVELAEKEGNIDYLATFKRNIGVTYYMASRFDKALEYLNEALDLSMQIGNEYLEARIYGAIGNVYNRCSDYTLALDFYLKALVLYEKGDNRLQIGRLSSNIGIVYQKLRNIDTAIEYFMRAETIAKQLDDKSSLASIYVSLSDIYIDIDRNKAIYYAEEAVKNFRQQDNKFSEVDATLALAKIYYSFEEYEKAINEAENALIISEKLESPFLISQTYLELSNIFYYQHKYAESEAAAIMAWENDSTDINLTNNMLYNIIRSNIYMNNPKRAEEYLDKLREQLSFYANSEYQNALSELEVLYETEKKDMKIDALEKEKRLVRLLVIAIGTTLLFVLVLFVMRHRLALSMQKLAEQQVKQLEKDKQLATVQAVLDGETAERSRLAKDLHDGLGSMLSVVKYNLREMETGVIIEKESVDRFKKAIEMLDESIQELRRVAHHMMPESLIRFGLKTSLTDFCDAIPNTHFHYYGDEKRLDSRLEILLYRSVHELVNNALKHAEADKIDVQIIQESNRISLVVQDNGKGFDTNTDHNGMGINNLQNRVDSYGGNMFISSSLGRGTEIHVEFELAENECEDKGSNSGRP